MADITKWTAHDCAQAMLHRLEDTESAKQRKGNVTAFLRANYSDEAVLVSVVKNYMVLAKVEKTSQLGGFCVLLQRAVPMRDATAEEMEAIPNWDGNEVMQVPATQPLTFSFKKIRGASKHSSAINIRIVPAKEKGKLSPTEKVLQGLKIAGDCAIDRGGKDAPAFLDAICAALLELDCSTDECGKTRDELHDTYSQQAFMLRDAAERMAA